MIEKIPKILVIEKLLANRGLTVDGEKDHICFSFDSRDVSVHYSDERYKLDFYEHGKNWFSLIPLNEKVIKDSVKYWLLDKISGKNLEVKLPEIKIPMARLKIEESPKKYVIWYWNNLLKIAKRFDYPHSSYYPLFKLFAADGKLNKLIPELGTAIRFKAYIGNPDKQWLAQNLKYQDFVGFDPRKSAIFYVEQNFKYQFEYKGIAQVIDANKRGEFLKDFLKDKKQKINFKKLFLYPIDGEYEIKCPYDKSLIKGTSNEIYIYFKELLPDIEDYAIYPEI
jgi:hypothetical protein